jgi:creatinine amidohydrolase
MERCRRWEDARWQDCSPESMADVIAVLPVAAVEQHGPHLPLGTDAMIMEGYLERVHERLPDDLDVRFLPTLAIGTSSEHLAFPGTLTLQPETLLRVLADIGDSVARSGCRKLVLLNSHGGNSSVIDIAARELRVRHSMLAVTVSWQRFGYPDGMFSDQEIEHGIHGGDIETSLMLAFRPDLVRTEHIADFPPRSIDMARDNNWLRAGRPAGFGWMAQDLSDSGAMGNAALASAGKGEACADYGATAFIELLQDVDEFDLRHLPEKPPERFA